MFPIYFSLPSHYNKFLLHVSGVVPFTSYLQLSKTELNEDFYDMFPTTYLSI